MDDDAYLKKFDRQIRTIGFEAQEIIKRLKVAVFMKAEEKILIDNKKSSFVAGEIIKNFALMGIDELHINHAAFESYENLSPNSLSVLNPDLNVILTQDNNSCQTLDFIIAVDLNLDPKRAINVCSRCYNFTFDKGYHSKCTNKTEDVAHIAKECLIGSILTQEIIKHIKGEPYAANYKLSLE